MYLYFYHIHFIGKVKLPTNIFSFLFGKLFTYFYSQFTYEYMHKIMPFSFKAVHLPTRYDTATRISPPTISLMDSLHDLIIKGTLNTSWHQILSQPGKRNPNAAGSARRRISGQPLNLNFKLIAAHRSRLLLRADVSASQEIDNLYPASDVGTIVRLFTIHPVIFH